MFGFIARKYPIRLAALGVFAAITGAIALPAVLHAQQLQATFIAVGGQTLVPYGWVDFCTRYRNECRTQPLEPKDIRLTRESMRTIERVNRRVNAAVKPMSDMEQWGRVDQWDYPTTGYGDCEDYVLFKRYVLMQKGFPRQALLVTVVKDERGDGHAVLTVKTDRGEFILDNLNDRVLPWESTPYKFVKRQSQSDPNVWVDIGEPTPAPLVVSR